MSEFEGRPQEVLWHAVATDPHIVSVESQIAANGVLGEEIGRTWRASCDATASHADRTLARQRLEALYELQGDPNGTRGLKDEVATDILGRYGVEPASIFKDPMEGSIAFDFNLGGRQIRLSINNTLLGVKTWDARLTYEEAIDVWEEVERQRMQGTSLLILRDALDGEIPEYLEAHEEGIAQGAEDINAATRAHRQHDQTLRERAGYLDFSLESSHISWSLPIALGIAGMTTRDAGAIVSRFGMTSSEHLQVLAPAVFKPLTGHPNQIVWHLASDGSVERSPSATVDDPQLTAIAAEYEAAQNIMAERLRSLAQTTDEGALARGGLLKRFRRKR